MTRKPRHGWEWRDRRPEPLSTRNMVIGVIASVVLVACMVGHSWKPAPRLLEVLDSRLMISMEVSHV